MESGALTKTMVESVVDRGLREIAADPARSLRKLVDMGGLLARGRFQKHFLTMIQDMLEREESPYYELARRVSKEADRNAVKTFGINMGWECWTAGAGRIRRFEEERGYNIPWSLTFRMDGAVRDAMTETDYRRVLSEAKAKGICAFFFFAEKRGDLALALELARMEPECAFLFFLPPELVGGAELRGLVHRDNAATLVDAGAVDWRDAARRLREERRLYGVYRRYRTEAEGDALCSGAWVEEVLEDAGYFLFAVAAPGCPPGLRAQVGRWAEECRTAQRYPALVLDYDSDILRVDRIISEGERFLGAGPDGTAFSCGDRGERELSLNFRTAGLTELLEQAERG